MMEVNVNLSSFYLTKSLKLCRSILIRNNFLISNCLLLLSPRSFIVSFLELMFWVLHITLMEIFVDEVYVLLGYGKIWMSGIQCEKSGWDLQSARYIKKALEHCFWPVKALEHLNGDSVYIVSELVLFL